MGISGVGVPELHVVLVAFESVPDQTSHAAISKPYFSKTLAGMTLWLVPYASRSTSLIAAHSSAPMKSIPRISFGQMTVSRDPKFGLYV